MNTKHDQVVQAVLTYELHCSFSKEVSLGCQVGSTSPKARLLQFQEALIVLRERFVEQQSVKLFMEIWGGVLSCYGQSNLPQNAQSLAQSFDWWQAFDTTLYSLDWHASVLKFK
eukprot:6488369-Amphidinium_carterae.2